MGENDTLVNLLFQLEAGIVSAIVYLVYSFQNVHTLRLKAVNCPVEGIVSHHDRYRIFNIQMRAGSSGIINSILFSISDFLAFNFRNTEILHPSHNFEYIRKSKCLIINSKRSCSLIDAYGCR